MAQQILLTVKTEAKENLRFLARASSFYCLLFTVMWFDIKWFRWASSSSNSTQAIRLDLFDLILWFHLWAGRNILQMPYTFKCTEYQKYQVHITIVYFQNFCICHISHNHEILPIHSCLLAKYIFNSIEPDRIALHIYKNIIINWFNWIFPFGIELCSNWERPTLVDLGVLCSTSGYVMMMWCAPIECVYWFDIVKQEWKCFRCSFWLSGFCFVVAFFSFFLFVLLSFIVHNHKYTKHNFE